MGSSSYKEDSDAATPPYMYKGFRRILKTTTWMSCLLSFSVSILGGLMLACWDLKYHRSNAQLWMVPFSLILFITPVLVWFSVFISDLFSPKEVQDQDHQHVDKSPPQHSTIPCDPEKR
ncbi:hypothetical protein ACH5RR_000025 [Cinchona calisaya]|uniref:Uncharacterized protein n=1 Tax=Cinchona calisaya TaxID=153742 RepID=A0ABD3B0C7_9GENT